MQNEALVTVDVPWWKSEGFRNSVFLLIATLFVGFPAEEASNISAMIIALFGGLWAFWNKIKGLKPIKFVEWISNGNTWTGLWAVLVSIVPLLPGELFTQLHQVVQAILGGNWQGIAIGVFALVNTIVKIVKSSNLLKE